MPVRILLLLYGFYGLFVTAPPAGPAQLREAFEGRLVHEGSGAPLAGATVAVAGTAGTSLTDDEGRFTLVPAPTPPFQLIVVLAGGQVARPVLIDALADGVATIRVAALADEAISVLGAAPSVDAAPASATTVLSSAQIASRNPENLMQALETLPGVSPVSEGHASVPAVRGLARGRTLFLIDGGRVTSERRVGPSATFLDPAMLEGVDVARGPGSVAYGSDALGGVISVRTRRAEPGSPLRARVTGTIGAGIPEGRGSFEISRGLARGGVLAQVHVRNADDYDSPAGEVFNSGWKDRGFLVNANHQVGSGLLTAGWQSDFGRDVERPRNNSRAVRFYYPFENSHRFTASYALAAIGGFRTLEFNGFLGAYEQRTDQDRAATGSAGRSIERADVSANDFHVKGTAERSLGRARLEFGVDVNGRYDLEALDITRTYDPAGASTRDTSHVSIEDARRTDAGIFVQVESAAGPLARLSGGLRGDRVTTRNVGGVFGDRSTSNGAASGFGAVALGPFRGLTVTAQVSRGFRDPVLSDRYFRGPSGRGFITGNPDLDPETSLQFDLASRYAVGATQLGVFWYHYRITDLIERYQTEPDVFFFRNRGRARLRGLEVESRSDLGNGYSIEIAAQIARGVALDDGADLDDVSPDTLSFLGRKALGTRGYAQARLAFHAEDDRPGPGEIAAPGATLFDIGGGWRLTRTLELRGLARNVFDDDYYASPDPRFVLAPGRSLSVTAVLTLD